MTTGTVTANGAVETIIGRKLDVGAGAKRDDGYETMDISPVFMPDFQHDLTVFPWPFEDATFVEVRCWHVLEHLPRSYFVFHAAEQPQMHGSAPERMEPRNALIDVMNEMHRILAPGGVADIEVPVFPYWTAIADPTHLSFFVPQTFAYFCTGESYSKAFRGARALEDHADHRQLYGIKTWVARKAYRDEMGATMRVELVKP